MLFLRKSVIPSVHLTASGREDPPKHIRYFYEALFVLGMSRELFEVLMCTVLSIN